MNGQAIKILLVEDNPGDARLVQIMLADGSRRSSLNLTFNLTYVERLDQAQACLRQDNFDLILLDLSLPDGHGLDTVSRVRHTAPDVPIVVMSGLNDEAMAIKAVQEGAQDYLVKGQADDYSLTRSIRYAIERKRIETAEREQRLRAETLAEVTLALTSRVSHTEVLDEILRQVQRLVPYQAANIMLLQGGLLLIARWQGYNNFGGDEFFHNLVQPLHELPIDSEVVQSKKAMDIPDTQQDPHWVVFTRTAWIRSHLCVPICLRERVMGVLRLDGDTVNQFSAKDGDRLQPLANAAAIALENAQLFEQTQASLAQTDALYQLTRSLIAFENLPDLLQAVANGLAEILPADRVHLVICDLEAKQVNNFISGGPNTDKAGPLAFDELWEGLVGWVIREFKPALSPKGIPDPRESPLVQQHRIKNNAGAILVTPLYYRAKTFGAIIAVNRLNQRDFIPQDLKLLVALTNQAAVAIENAQLLETTRQHVSDLEALRQASLSLASSLDLPTVLEAILESANLLTNLQGAQIYLYQNDQLTFGATLWGKGMAPQSPPLPNNLMYQVARQGQAMVIPNISDYPLYADIFPNGEGAVVGLPLKIGGRVLGVMTAEYYQPRTWPKDELRVLDLLADQAAVAIENARLYAQAQQEIAERVRAESKLNEYREHLEELVWERTAELQQAMTEAAEARDKINAILQSVADGLIVTDSNYRVILANPAAEDLLGVKLADMLGYEVGAGIKDDRLRGMIRDAFEWRSSGYEVDLETETPGDKHKKVLRARTALVDDHQGQPLGAVTIIQDVTRLREIDRLKTELLTTTAHELRTPLTSILGFSEILLTRELHKERQQQYLTMINQQSKHLANIITDLVDVSRIETGQSINLKLETVNIAKLIENTITFCGEKIASYQLQFNGLADLPMIWGDSFRLSQVGQNLLSNAINYSSPGSVIVIRGRVIPGYVEMSIQDQGIGITPEQQTHLFKPFYRAHTSHTDISGTGLGLVTSKLIIEQHGGQIWLESTPKIGTTVYFTLPLAGHNPPQP